MESFSWGLRARRRRSPIDGPSRSRRGAALRVPALLLLFALAVAGLAPEEVSGAPALGASAQSQRRANVIVIMTDDQTVQSMRVMRNVRSLLGDQGATFTSSFVSFSLCCPSRATFLTGQYTHNHGVMGNRLPRGGYRKLNNSNTLPVWLARAGYHTAHVGKYLNGYGRDDPTEIPPGWTEWYGSVDPSTYRFYGYTLNENGQLVTYGDDPGSYQADVYARKAVEIIRRRAGKRQPFFLSVAFLAPHSGQPHDPDDPPGHPTPVPAPRHRNAFATQPLPTPPSFNELDVSDKPAGMRRRRLITPDEVAAIVEGYQQRLESLLAVDEAVAKIVAALRQTRQLGRTFILFTSDNGFFHGEHRVTRGKVLLYEPSIRVPLIVRGPSIPRGRRLSQLVANIDLAPTIVAITGARPGRTMDGRSLLALARRPTTPLNRDLLIVRTAEGSSAEFFSAIRTPRYLYAEYANGETELYDLLDDPHQLNSLHANPALESVRRELSNRLHRLVRCKGARPVNRGGCG